VMPSNNGKKTVIVSLHADIASRFRRVLFRD
jgi:hypothetical protein